MSRSDKDSIRPGGMALLAQLEGLPFTNVTALAERLNCKQLAMRHVLKKAEKAGWAETQFVWGSEHHLEWRLTDGWYKRSQEK